MKRLIRASADASVTQRELDNAALARLICGEGIVLLENKGALPLKGGKAALYGAGVRHGSFGGSGSGENDPRYRVSPEQGFINGGWEIVSRGWLDEFDALHKREHENYIRSVMKATARLGVFGRMEYVASHPFIPSGGKPVTAVDAAETDTAVYILTRHAGEGGDRTTAPGDYYITDSEKATLRSLCESFEKVVLVLNIGSIMDLSFADELGINAIVYMMQGGMEAGNGLFDVLTGRVNPSGKLADSWAQRYEDYPCHDTFSTRGGREHEEDYSEGIYVGYRWFDAMGVKPRYAFGHGLSYTHFTVSPGAATAEGGKVNIHAVVQNIGSLPGKEVVQLYVAAPEGGLDKPTRELKGFAKTGMIQPGESETVVIKVDNYSLASFNEARSSWEAAAGEYKVMFGANVEDIRAEGAYSLSGVKRWKVNNVLKPNLPLETMTL